MSALINARNISKAFGSQLLFEDVSVTLAPGDRLGVIGPNGAGKSTLLRIFAGQEHEDSGDLMRRRHLRASYVQQTDDYDDDLTPRAIITEAATAAGDDGLDPDTRAAIVLSQMAFEQADQPVGTLSGGWKKRLSLACGLATDPELLLLDEPTNHLDLEGVRWLETFLARTECTLAFITHDRVFLDRVATRVLELSRAYPNGTFEATGNYSEFVRRKEAFLEAQLAEQRIVANTVRRDTAWLQQGIQGRQTRNKTQVRDAERRRGELADLQSRNRANDRVAGIDFQATDRKTRKLVELNGIAKSMGGRELFSDVELLLGPGMRLGLVGPNGSGKTTLLRIIAGELEPDAGTRDTAHDVRIVRFSQHRESLNPMDTLHQALCPVGDRLEVAGQSVHVSAWAQRFLFDSTQLKARIGTLSGGEQARVVIANLMLTPADVLLLDEPTNDLDIQSLEVLETSLAGFPGALVLVTHDRFMLKRLANSFFALDGLGGARPHASYQQFERAAAETAVAATTPAKTASDAQTGTPTRTRTKRKLSYKEQRELDGMEAAILEAEADVETLTTQTNDPALMSDHARSADVFKKLTEAQARVDALYARWSELSAG